MNKLPTDRQVLRCIFEMYRADYPGEMGTDGRSKNDPFVPINVRHIAGHLACPPEIVFGRLYFHLNAKYGYKKENDAHVSFFHINFQDRGHCVQFPLLTSVLSSLEEDSRRQSWALGISILALIASVGAIVAQVLTSK